MNEHWLYFTQHVCSGISKTLFSFHSFPIPIRLSAVIAWCDVGWDVAFDEVAFVFGLDYLSSHFRSAAGGWLTYLCGFTAVYTAYRAFRTDDLKQRSPFLQLGQLSYIILAILMNSNRNKGRRLAHVVTRDGGPVHFVFAGL